MCLIPVHRNCDVNSEHFKMISKIKLPKGWNYKKKNISSCKNIYFKVHLLQQGSIRRLHLSKIKKLFRSATVSMNVDEEWQYLKEIILKTVEEVLGKRAIRKGKKELNIWNDKIKVINNKKKAYVKYLQTNLIEDKI